MSSLPLPLEVIERILRYAFLPLPASPTTEPEPTPTPSTSHLLLVSKGIRQLSLPLFWFSVTIAQPQDWITFFDPKKGLLIGEQGRGRRAWLQELRIVVEATVPVSQNGPSNRQESSLHFMDLYQLEGIPRLVFQHAPPSLLPELACHLKEQEERELVVAKKVVVRRDPGLGAALKMNRGSSLNDDLTETRVWIHFKKELQDYAKEVDQDRRIYFRDLLEALRPLHLSFPLDYWITHRLEDLRSSEENQPYHDFEVEDGPVVEITASSKAGEEVDLTYVPFNVHFVIRKVRGTLVGFSDERLKVFEKWLIKERRDMVRRYKVESRWSWTRGDGTRFEFDYRTPRGEAM